VSPEPYPDKQAALYKKLWHSQKFMSERAKDNAPWVHDGKKLAWSTASTKERRFTVDLDEERGLAPGREGAMFEVIVKNTGVIRMSALQGYLEGKSSWDNSVLETMTALDHILRQGPSEKMTLIKRSFFNHMSETRRFSGNVVEAIKGIYFSIRLNDTYPGGTGLGVNVDVANQAFWVGQNFPQLVRNFLNNTDKRWSGLQVENLTQVLAPVRGPDGKWVQSDAFKALRKLHNLRFVVSHRGKTEHPKEYKIKRFVFEAREGGANAKAVSFDWKKDGQTRKVTVFDYYALQYKKRIAMHGLPLIETTRDGLFPFEVCEVNRLNRYPFKLDPNQTSEMIKFAVQRPPQRSAEIKKMVENLNWAGDKWLKAFGISISPNMQEVNAKFIPNPEVQFSNTKINPRTSGRWDLRGAKFFASNPVPLKSWAFVVLDNCVDKQVVENFAKVFSNTFKNHGGRIEKPPQIYGGYPAGSQHDKIIDDVHDKCGMANKFSPQIVFVIMKEKSTWIYERLKKNADCRKAMLTQMVQAVHVQKAQGQYCSNVACKVLAKLGGQVSRVWGPRADRSALFDVPTMMIGCDVSHASPGSQMASMAALTISMDKDAARYRASVQTNGYRKEIVDGKMFGRMLGNHITDWCRDVGRAPDHVFYFRDGVSEGQFAQVLDQEVAALRDLLTTICRKTPKITAIVATKRHHIRFFPQKGDKNGNALPGTLVEREVTHPFHYDFYLCSHVAIQGTARPVHYNVIHDECKLKPDLLQKIIYHQCYQYCRATTPVSLHPAVYYAHQAGTRARAHENVATSDRVPESDRKQVGEHSSGLLAKSEPDKKSTTSTNMSQTASPDLLPLGGPDARADMIPIFRKTMWWV